MVCFFECSFFEFGVIDLELLILDDGGVFLLSTFVPHNFVLVYI